MDIRFFDENHNTLFIESRFISSNWQIKYCDFGDYAGEFGQNKALFDVLKNNDFVMLEQNGRQGIVTGLSYDDGLTVYGRSLNYILSKMKTLEPQSFTAQNIETIARTLATQAFANVTNFELGELAEIDKTTNFAIEKLENPYESITRLLSENNLGFSVFVDSQKWKFKVLPSQETTLILSEGLKNATEVVYSENVDNYGNSALLDDGEGNYSEITNDNTKTGIKKWYCDIDSSEKLGECKKKKEIELKTKSIVYGTDYTLGDIVRVKKNGEIFKKIITGIIFDYSTTGVTQTPTLSEVAL